MVEKRVPTICFTLEEITPQDFATQMGRAGVGLRDGHLFAPRLMNRLGLSMETGAIRVSLVHYNTIEEVRRFEHIAERVVDAVTRHLVDFNVQRMAKYRHSAGVIAGRASSHSAL
jgi:selenocysteine lyase/cysteine desulfurase